MAELRTFVFTDISGSVRLKDEMVGRSVTERDQAFIFSILTPHRRRIEAQLAEYGGRVVSTAGDGHFLVFDNTIHAAQWAVGVQESHRDDPIRSPSGDPVEVRISMHVGVPQVDPGDPDNFVGKSVDYTSRLNDYATGGQILVSRSVMAILDDVGLEGMRLHAHGRRNLKGIGNVEVHELLYDDHGPRPMRNQPKSHGERQWTVVPTMGFGASSGGNATTVLGGTALRRVGNYELEAQIGSGGMGDVYKARHVQFGRVRAVKVIKPQFVSAGHDEVIRRFYNEIKAAGRLEHRNIVVAIDSSSPTDKVHYLVMEYIEGVSLDELVGRHGPLPIAEACEVIRQAARGLQYIHKNDMVHRDIKPSNLMVTLIEGDQVPSDSTLTQESEGDRAVVKILDLGLALLAADGHDRVTRFDHKAMGTGMYMPPEQWKTTSVDIRADIYSLGCTLYHLLAGNPPFIDSDLRPEKAHEKAPVPPIHSSLQPVPKKLADILRKMLEKRPEDRYATPAEVSAALAPFAEGHRLATLVKAHQTGVTVTSALTPTKPDGASRVETRRSRPWFSSASQLGDRQFLLSKIVPLALIALFLSGAAWLLRGSRLERLRQAEEQARSTLPSFAKTAAQRVLPAELAMRFETLANEAADPELGKLLLAYQSDPSVDNRDAIQRWLKELPDEHGEEIKDVESWFIQDASGVQVARSPRDDKSVGKNYWYRDYFHGGGRDLEPEDEAARAAVRPISAPHLSSVYRSTTSGLLKVAFSVPIWDQPAAGEGRPADPAGDPPAAPGEPPPRKVIGVLAMSMNVHEFTVLEKELAGGSEVVLIDLRDDYVTGTRQRGLILHHPRLDQKTPSHVPAEILKRIDDARPLADPEFESGEHFLSDFPDPIENGSKAAASFARYWGAFEPVRYLVNESDADGARIPDRFGWVVLVQKSMAQ